MDFFERLFGISPDAGNGSLELVYLAVLALAVYAVTAWRRARRRPVREE